MYRANYSYSKIKQVGPNDFTPIANPLSYCIDQNMDQRFLHGSQADSLCGQSSKNCQAFLSEYCANGWDGYCELASRNNDISRPNNLSITGVPAFGMTQGQILIFNTAIRKYLVALAKGVMKYEKFDPLVATSPMISYWNPGCNEGGGTCYGSTEVVPVLAVDPKIIDNDIVMDKILSNPLPYNFILINIYNNMKRMGTLQDLKGTKLGKYYDYALSKVGGSAF